MIESIDWESAINTRRSTRSYTMESVEEAKMNLLKNFVSNMQLPYDHKVKVQFFKANPDKKLYSVFAAPPDNAAFIANTDTKSISSVGFVGELLILYATSLGLSTCWYGHYLLLELQHNMPQLGAEAENQNIKWGYGKQEAEGERAVCITPIGYWKSEGARIFDRMQESLISYKRKPISALLEADLKEEMLPSEILYAIDLARKAPSAANSQHWRFKVSHDFKVVSIAMPENYKHIKWEHPNVDVGICACHFWLGLVIKNVQSKVYLTEDEGRALWRFEL
ncbi:MAG: hypothetical protein K0S71_2877 [Clostridia bacterium]|jgi:nitroreductase|nr:hypothetical protein [Clostridia bacterium]